jgi:DNA-binding NtrC family response regulator
MVLAAEKWSCISTLTREPVRDHRQLVVHAPDGEAWPLDRPLRIGKAGDNELILQDDWVSRYHCVIETGASRPRVRDLGSKNGTFVNGLRIGAAELEINSVLALGNTRLRVSLEEEPHTPLLGETELMRELRRQIDDLAPTELSVLILGETGTGKELVARALHDRSGRAGAFVPVNCGAIPRELVESELFGHERGAFTGAALRHKGLFQEADRGTLFLDEIGELPLELQPRLLRVLESGLLRPVGQSREQRVSVRVIAATHVDLWRAVELGRFREDLFYRLEQACIVTPPLRSRAADIPLLAHHLLAELCEHGSGHALSGPALELLKSHHWPGNVRELRNVLRRAAALAGPVLEPSDLRLTGRSRTPHSEGAIRIDGRPFLEIEREVLEWSIRRHGGNKRAAALALQIPKSTLCDKAKRYGIAG